MGVSKHSVWEQRYLELYARVERLTKGEGLELEYEPEGSCLAFLRWEELRRSEEMRRCEEGSLIKRRLMQARLDGFSDAVNYLAKLKLAYVVPELGEIR